MISLPTPPEAIPLVRLPIPFIASGSTMAGFVIRALTVFSSVIDRGPVAARLVVVAMTDAPAPM
ncbi:hypothetical protein Athai_68280 [Actinocatenispora thailandica]|uniref:Uncharacterized protein n=1 Tax=Actinocatenispora thailandica TaxID=227318 RepID=A0A7R7DWS6_9ACTN|nr:hypothetical protein Athai_68280 [Actinocatenispora thailandica]